MLAIRIVRPQLGIGGIARMAGELEELFGRRVDLVTRPGLRRHVRAAVEREAIVLYEA